jgi:amino acid transporter
MAELASLYPTAGGLYFWAFRLGGRGPAFTTAWFNMAGQVTITAGIDIAAATYLIGTATRLLGLPADAKVPVFGAVTS